MQASCTLQLPPAGAMVWSIPQAPKFGRRPLWVIFKRPPTPSPLHGRRGTLPSLHREG